MTILNMSEAAKLLGKSPAAMRQGYQKWQIPHFRVGGQIKFTREALEEWINKQLQSTEKETIEL